MKNKPLLSAGFALFLISAGASAGTVPFDIQGYNFELDGGGGGLATTVNGSPMESFCDNFADEIQPYHNYTANVTTLGTSANLSNTRFGGVTSWTSISLNTSNTSLNSQDDTFFNSGQGSTGLARYEMAAYLVSLYSTTNGNSTANNQIQEAIWTDMDPSAGAALINPSGVNASADLEQAATWYNNMNTPANLSSLNSFLGNFEIVSASDMNWRNGLGGGGFQEQIVMTPEPRGGIWMVLGLLGVFFTTTRRKAVLQRA